MSTEHDRDLRDLLRRVDEVRGLAQRAETGTTLEADNPESLARVLEQLVEELERSHRRLIESLYHFVQKTGYDEALGDWHGNTPGAQIK